MESQHWVRDVMEKTFPLGVFKDRTKEAQPRPLPAAPPALDSIPHILGIDEKCLPEENTARTQAKDVDLHVRVAGFGGQGVLLLGEVLAEAGLDAGLRGFVASVVWAGDALGYFELPRAVVEGADRFAAGDGAQCAGGDE